LSAEIKESANKFLSEKEMWLNNNPAAEKSEYEAQITEINTKMQELTKSVDAEESEPTTHPAEEAAAGPHIEEID
jgi:hypothetical protein